MQAAKAYQIRIRSQSGGMVKPTAVSFPIGRRAMLFVASYECGWRIYHRPTGWNLPRRFDTQNEAEAALKWIWGEMPLNIKRIIGSIRRKPKLTPDKSRCANLRIRVMTPPHAEA